MNRLLPRTAVVIGVAAALAAPASQALLGWGQSAGQFSAQGDETLRAAGWAFSIWGLIYAGLFAFAVYQLPVRTDALAKVRWPAAGAALGCGLWIVAAGVDSRWATVGIITASAVAAVAAAAYARRGAATAGLAHRLLALWPLSLLAGWLTIAAVVNLMTVLTAEDWIFHAARTGAAVAAVAAAALAAGAVAVGGRLLVYLGPVIWGLVAVASAARADDRPAVAATAVAAALVLTLLAGRRLIARAAAHGGPGPTGREP